jgi:hypothetical protein
VITPIAFLLFADSRYSRFSIKFDILCSCEIVPPPPPPNKEKSVKECSYPFCHVLVKMQFITLLLDNP